MSTGELALEIRSTTGASQIRGWERGGEPSAMWIPALSAALGVTADYLLTGKESCAEPRPDDPGTAAGA